MFSKKNKIIVAFGLFLLSVSNIYSQQDPQYTQYMYNMNVLNPAYAGSKGIFSVGLLGRSQWAGLEGAPRTATLSLHSPVWNNLGLGLSVIHDRIGPVQENNIYTDFSYTISLSEQGNLAFGIKAGFTFLDIRVTEMNEPDPLNIPINKVTPNFGAGVYYYTDSFYVGFSAPNFLETHYLEKDGIYSEASESVHYFLTGGYVFKLNQVKLKPSLMIKATSGVPFSVDLSLNTLIKERLELGMSYRVDDSVSGIVGVNVTKDFRIGYAYDHNISEFEAFNFGSHSLMLLYDFYGRTIKSPRFF